MADIGEHLLAQEGGLRGGARGGARRAQPAVFAGERDEILGPAGAAADAGETVLQDAAVEVRADGLIREGPPEPVAPLEALLPAVTASGVMRLEEAVQRRRLRLTPAAERAVGSSHGSRRSRGAEG